MKARDVAPNPPVSSRTRPRSHVVSETVRRRAQVSCPAHPKPEVARTEHGSDNEGSRDDEVTACTESALFEEIRLDDFAAHERFQWRRRHHVESEAEPGNVGPEVCDA